jgi:hypothetical protein
VSVGLGPGLAAVGLVSDSHTLMDHDPRLHSVEVRPRCGDDVRLGADPASGWRLTLRIQNPLFWLVSASVILPVLTAIFTSHGAFIANSNHFARPFSHSSDTYHGVIAAAHRA